MKAPSTLRIISLLLFFNTNLFAQNFWVPDSIFRNSLIQQCPACFTANDSLIIHNADSLGSLINSFNLYGLGINDLTGIEYFNGLQHIDCSANNLVFLPPIPNTVTDLSCSYNNLNTLPTLPSTLQILYCDNNQILGLPNLPASLLTLVCGSNLLTSIPVLPNGLQNLDVSYSNFSSLPSLPSSLRHLNINYNQFTTLPSFNNPNDWLDLQCSHNQLTSLPSFSPWVWWLDCSYNKLSGNINLPSVDWMYCDSNQISSFTSIPSSIQILSCSNNLLSSIPLTAANNLNFAKLYCTNNIISNLPKLPSNIEILDCSNNPISCLPVLPSTLIELTDTNTLISCVPNIPANTIFEPANPMLCDSTFPTCYYAYVKGYVFNDLNSNGIKSANEKGIPLEVSYSSVNSVQADTSGFFRAYCENASTTFQITVPKYYTLTTTNPHTVTTPVATFTLYFGLQAAVNVNDLNIDINPNNPFRPGFTTYSRIHYQNIGTNSIANVKVKYLKPSGLSTLSAIPPATSSNGDTLIWNIGTLDFARDGFISILDSVSSTTTIGDTLSLQAWIDPLAGDSTSQDNYSISQSIATGSFDPNDKSVSNDSIITNTTEYLEYMIRFQNTGTDTAFTVIVTDTLSEDLNISTIETLSYSHKNTFWVEHGTAKWYFANILLPDSNVNEAGSHGFVKFRIKPKANLGAGIQIPNTANIYFDYNTAVVTNTIVVDVTPLSVPLIADEKLQLFPNPVHQLVHLRGSNNKSLGKVTLVNSEGKIIESKTISNSTYEWQVEQLPAGIYIFKGENWKEKILKK